MQHEVCAHFGLFWSNVVVVVVVVRSSSSTLRFGVVCGIWQHGVFRRLQLLHEIQLATCTWRNSAYIYEDRCLLFDAWCCVLWYVDIRSNVLYPCSILKAEAEYSSETWVPAYLDTRRPIPEEIYLIITVITNHVTIHWQTVYIAAAVYQLRPGLFRVRVLVAFRGRISVRSPCHYCNVFLQKQLAVFLAPLMSFTLKGHSNQHRNVSTNYLQFMDSLCATCIFPTGQ